MNKCIFMILGFLVFGCNAELQWRQIMHSPWKLSDGRDIKNKYAEFLDRVPCGDMNVTRGQIIRFLEQQLKTIENSADRLLAAATLFTILKHDTPEDMTRILELLRRCYGEEAEKLFEEALEKYRLYEEKNQKNKKKKYAKDSPAAFADAIITTFTNV